MMYILTDIDDVVLNIANNMTVDEDEVVWMDGAGYGLFGQKTHTLESVPEGVTPNRYKYVDGEFIVNPDYSDPDEEINDLKKKVSDLEEVIDVLLGGNV